MSASAPRPVLSPEANVPRTRGFLHIVRHGTGPRDEVGHTGVYPVSAMDEASPDAPIKGQMEWGQGERGAAGYEDHGESEVITIPPEGGATGAG